MSDTVLLFGLLLVFFVCVNVFRKKRVIYYSDPLIDKIKHDVSRLDDRISSLQFYSSNESYTEDKKKIFLCLKDENGKYYDYNMLIYVAIHECSHALTNVIDIHHVTPEFRSMFNSLLSKAYKLGIYDKDKPLIKYYCGIDLDIENIQR